MSTELNLEEIEARCEKATPGPWMRHDNRTLRVFVAAPNHYRICRMTNHHGDPDKDFNTDFIAHARTDVPALCREVRRLRDWQSRAAAEIRGEAHDECRCDRCIRRCALLSELPKAPDGD